MFTWKITEEPVDVISDIVMWYMIYRDNYAGKEEIKLAPESNAFLPWEEDPRYVPITDYSEVEDIPFDFDDRGDSHPDVIRQRAIDVAYEEMAGINRFEGEGGPSCPIPEPRMVVMGPPTPQQAAQRELDISGTIAERVHRNYMATLVRNIDRDAPKGKRYAEMTAKQLQLL